MKERERETKRERESERERQTERGRGRRRGNLCFGGPAPGVMFALIALTPDIDGTHARQ